jgi:hypothetical protein
MQVVSTVCDFGDGLEGQARRFSLDGQDFVIDVCTSHSASLGEVVGLWAGIARPRRLPAVRPVASRRRSAAIRAWAAEHAGELGVEMSGHGRIPVSVYEAYEAAH